MSLADIQYWRTESFPVKKWHEINGFREGNDLKQCLNVLLHSTSLVLFLKSALQYFLSEQAVNTISEISHYTVVMANM